MEYIKHDMGNYNLYLIKTKKFKTINISINLRKENKREDVVYFSIIKELLALATAKYPDLDKLSRARINVYNPHINIESTVSGQERWLFLESSFVNEKYTDKGMNQKSLEFIFDYIWKPYINKNSFDEKLFDICRHEYIEDLKSLKDDADRYSSKIAWQIMDIFPFKEMSIDECIKYAQNLTAQKLYEYYQKIFDGTILDIFIAGDYDDEKIINVIKELVIGNFKPSYQNRLIVQKKPNKIKKITEKTDNEQSKLVIGLKLTDLTDYERKYVSLVYNNILGGSWNSKLNKVVREENSLCYYIYSNRKMPFNVMFIHSGIDKNDVNKTVELIENQMDKLKKGDITDEELQVVKDIYNNALTNIEDNQFSIVDNVISQIFSDTDSIEERRKKMNKVTKEEISNVSKKVYIDTIFLLEGGKVSG